jgi:3-hydroxyisobutyrate dehydrogenase-like beta-hydroxyacid dehydrogenase
MPTAGVLGFVGLGVMGEPMCRNLARKSGATVVAFDDRPAPLAALAADGVQATSAAEVTRRAIVFLCLPGEPQVRAVCLCAEGGLAALVEPGQTVVDMSTCPVGLARELHQAFGARGAAFADAPIARTAQAARDGTLSIMVGAEPALFARLCPFLGCMGSEVTHCGAVGAGQAVKLMNNMVVAQTVVALAEPSRWPARPGAVNRACWPVARQGSPTASNARNHGMKSLCRRSPDAGRLPPRYI